MTMWWCLLVTPFVIASATEIGLDTIMHHVINKDYDVRVRPRGRMGGPVETDVNIMVRSFSNIDFVAMHYDLQITFRETWKDQRLDYSELANGSMSIPDFVVITDKDAIWRPDTFFTNEKRAHRHDIDKPNVLIRIGKDGTVLFSERITLTLSCPMHLAQYPMDKQYCRLEMASYAYTTRDLLYDWAKTNPVQLHHGVNNSLPSFVLTRTETGYCTSHTSTGNYSCIYVEFTLERQFSYYIVQVYIPSILLVIVSWVSFWLDRTAVPARVTLGVTTLLTMTTQAASINSKLPPVSYIKAIDVWIGVCLLFIFGAVLEYAWVTYVANQAAEKEKMREYCREKSVTHSPVDESGPKPEDENLLKSSVSEANKKSHFCSMLNETDEAKLIDARSRIIFPVLFIIFNILYWVGYHLNNKEH